jgi:hypothetical protein
LRVNAELHDHLTGGGSVTLDLTLEAFLHPDGGTAAPLDLHRRAARLLVENLALVHAQVDGEADLLNLG